MVKSKHAKKTARRSVAPAVSGDAETEQRILEAAHRVFLRRGTAGARMQEIADEAGVNKALLHYYFRSKERLADAVFATVARELLAPVLEVLASDAPIAEKVERFIRVQFANLIANPYLPGYILSELTHGPERAAQLLEILTGMPAGGTGMIFLRIHEQIESEVAAGRMRPIPAPHLIVNLISLCAFPFAARPMIATALQLDEAGFDALMSERADELVRFVLASLRP